MTTNAPVPPSLPARIDRARNKALFTDVFGNRFDTDAVRQLYETNRQCPLGSPDAIQVPPSELQGLVSELDGTIGKYKSPSSGLIGNMLYFHKGASSSPRLPTVEDYARILVLATARIGADRVATLYSAWLQGEPILLRQCALLTGVKTDGELHPVDGMHLDTLPTDSSDFPRSLRINEFDIHEQFSHRAMLCIDYHTDPALYDPAAHQEIAPFGPRRRDFVNPALGAVSLESFCRSMSLIADNQVDWFIAWDDYGDIEAFFLGSSFGSNRKQADNRRSPVIVSEKDVRASLDLHAHLAEFSKLDLAIARWRRSKSSRIPYEQLVELRIALESVLLSDDRGNVGEKRHRLAIRGAWFLGTTFAERKRSFRTLRTLYDYASSVIHAGNPRETEAAPLSKITSDAQHLCRAAILRIANARTIPDWTDVVLDGHVGDDGTPTN